MILNSGEMIVYAFPWPASALLRDLATLTSTVVALRVLLVDGIDKKSKKGSMTGNHEGTNGEV